MKYICSGSPSKGVVEADECLSCAKNRENTCGIDYGLIRALLDRQDRSEEVHVTDLTGCLRKAYWEKVNPQPRYVHEGLVLALGTAVHGFLEGSDDHMDCELPLEGLGVQGTADVVYKDGRVVDWKSTRWMYPDKLPYGSHALQVNIYAELLRQQGRPVESLAIQYIDMSGPTKCRKCKQVVVPQNGDLVCPVCGDAPKGAHRGAILKEIPMLAPREIKELIEERGGALNMALESGLVPDAEPGYLCAYCSFTVRCPEAAV